MRVGREVGSAGTCSAVSLAAAVCRVVGNAVWWETPCGVGWRPRGGF